MEYFTFINIYCDDKHALIKACHQRLLERYPDLHLRWVRIHGKRWAHLYGDTDRISWQPLKLSINNNYGIFIDNPQIIPEADRQEIMTSLEKCFK